MTDDSKTAFKVKTSGEAFHDYTESEVLRLRQTDAQFDEDFYREAQELVSARLIAASAQIDLDESSRAESEA